ncbi:MAG: translation initiation factor IF-2 [Prevotellaceae bacterium]|jgi:translation initiation factor IF-2|nr:translation initiation factor IF-2 [Prevotellaceae bacterium]
MARLVQITKELNIGLSTAVDFLGKKGQPIEENPNVKLSDIQENILISEFSKDKNMKAQADKQIKQRQEKPKLTTIAVEGYGDEEKTKKIVKEEVKQEKEPAPVEENPAQKPQNITELVRNDKEEKQVKVEVKIEVEQKIEQPKTVEPKPEKIVEKQEKKPAQNIDKQPVAEKKQEQKPEQKKEQNQHTKSDKNIQNKENQNKNHQQQNQPKKDKSKQQNLPQQPKTQQVEQTVPAITEKKEPEIFKYESRFAPKIGFKPTGEKIDLNKVVDGVARKPLSRKEKKEKYRELERQKREAERIIRQEREKQERKQGQNQGQNQQKTDQHKREEERRRRRREERERQQQKQLKNPVIKVGDLKKPEFIPTTAPTLKGVSVKGKIELPVKNAPESHNGKKKKRKRIGGGERIDIPQSKDKKENFDKNKNNTTSSSKHHRKKISKEDVNQNIKNTLAKLNENKRANKKSAKYRHDKREAISERLHEQQYLAQEQSKILKITEFITANELAVMMNVPVTDVIKTYMRIGMFVSINQRLDAETINLVVEEFGYTTEFISADAGNIKPEEEVDNEADLKPRPPIVTVMGHVDHGKTSLLDYIRKTNVIAGEAGGITQHIGAYNVKLEDGRQITFLDTPGHEAFTAMRARGAKVTDIAIIIVAADDNVMPQTIEAINHASAAGVPIVFAINKIDKDGADPDRIKSELANMNYQVEEWGGKHQSQDISAKKGIGVKELMEKVLLEAEILDLKANPNRKANGSVIEFTKDKGRGNVATLLVSNGTLKVGDIVVVGYAYGRIRAMFNERNQKINEAKPSEPVMILGLKGELQAGDNFNVMETEQEARNIVAQREQLKREQTLRQVRHLTLDELSKRIANGGFQELNIIVKGDVDGSIEALSDSLIKLSTPEIQVNVIHKGVGQINESDVSLAMASNAIVVGFNVRPTAVSRRMAEQEQIDIRLYSIIYQAIEEVKAAMEGMLLPEKTEKVTATLEVRETFHIGKVGTIAGCMVKDGKIKRNSKIRLIRDGIVICTSEIESLKHEKDDVKEVNSGYECGLNIANYNDVKVGDIIEAYEEFEVKKTL